jgi:hypothetical protein
MILLAVVLMMVLYVLIIVSGLCYIGKRWRGRANHPGSYFNDGARFAHVNGL